MPLFETVADDYDSARPTYPPDVFDALGPLTGSVFLDVGAGTGIASRALVERGASVIALDHGPEMLRRAVTRTPALPAVAADGAVLPIRSDSVDLVCFAQAWHWVDALPAAAEIHRVLRPGGRFAAWWSHARADGETWFDAYWSEVSRACPGVASDQRDIDWGATMGGEGLFAIGERSIIAWVRQTTVERWTTEVASCSYVAALPADTRRHLLDTVNEIVRRRFVGPMLVPYETWLWIATPRSTVDSNAGCDSD